jgi:NTP pyrophosphatase (non-canonical NTP hydrolase)
MTDKTLSNFVAASYKIACDHGFHDEEKPMEHWLMLVITEVSEIVEADRKGKHAQVAMFKRECVTPQPEENKMKHWAYCFECFIKDTVEDEMADACIRLFDLAGMMGWKIDVGQSKKLKEHYSGFFREHTCAEIAWELCRQLTPLYGFERLDAEVVLYYIECWAKSEGIDLEWHICQKMEYNKQRKRLHGKRY